MQDNKNVMTEPQGGHSRRTISLLILAAVVVLAVGGFLLYRKSHSKPATIVIKNPVTAIEERSADATQQDLTNKDYTSYQLRLTGDANDYISGGHYTDAQRVLDEIVQNVPQGKIISQTYRAYWYLYQQNGDVANRKKYALLTANQLKAEGQGASAVDFEKDASGN